MSKRKKLYLIDGSNYVFRAYYAIPHLSNSKGMPTNALLGFTQMLLKLLKDENPEYIGVTFDTKEPTFRKELYNAYKANRPEPPEDLVPQFPYFPKIVKAFDIQVLIKPGFEADDVIGTMTKSAVEDGFDVVIMTGDKDMMQLVNEHVSIWDAMKNKTIGIKEVEEKFGVKPDRVIDVLGLSGDASDNIPGVSGVGPKTATKLITEFGSVEGVIENVDKLKGKLKDRFKENIDKARLSKKLVTIKTDVPLEIKPRDLKYNGYERDALVNVLDEFEFKRLRLELTEKKEETGTSYKIITSEEELHELISVIKKVGKFAFYTQASHDNPWWGSVVGIAISCQIGSAFYIPMAHIGLDAANQIHAKSALAALKVVFEDKNIVKYGHNMKRSMALFKMYDLKLKGQLIDSMVVSYVLKPTGKHSIVDIAENILNTSLAKREDTVGKGKKEINFQALELKIANDFMSQRADYLFRICEQLFPELDKSDQKNVYYDIEMSLIDILSDMESYGVLVDKKILRGLENEFTGELKKLEAKIYNLAGEEFNINSPKQLGEILFDKLGLPGAKKTKTGYSTSADILENLAGGYELPGLVLQYRGRSKLLHTYIEALPVLINPKTGRIHTSFNQAVTATGRLSSSDPNLQNIPIRTEEGRKIRKAFVAKDGFELISADYSQIELRILAHVSKDQALIKAFNSGVDIHSLTASGVFGVDINRVTKEQRAVGKTVNFATIYGQTAFGLSKQLGIGVGEASKYIENYFKKYPMVQKYRDSVLDKARKDGFVETIFKRRRYVSEINNKNMMIRQIAEREAFNMIFQGANADIIKMAMIKIHNGLPALSPNARMLMQVHDELVFEVPSTDLEKVSRFVKDVMEGVTQLDVPITVDVNHAPNWADAH